MSDGQRRSKALSRTARQRERRLSRRRSDKADNEAAADALPVGRDGDDGGWLASTDTDVDPIRRRPIITIDNGGDEALRNARRRMRRRAVGAWMSFAALVAAPSATTAWYLFGVAVDQYASTTAFAVRSLDGALSSPFMELFGGSTDTTAADAELLYAFLQSQPAVERIDARIDLHGVYSAPGVDWFYRLRPDASIESLSDHWNAMNTISYDRSSGIIYFEARAFRSEDARRIASAVRIESEALINRLSTDARADALRVALDDLAAAEKRVQDARLALGEFRNREGVADVDQNIAQSLTLIGQLTSERAALRARVDSAEEQLDADSVVLRTLGRQIAALDTQIAEERARIASAAASDGARSLVDIAREQERLMVEVEFATNVYTTALSAVEAARAEARRAQRYLATHIAPTLADEPIYPERLTWSISIAGVMLVTWSILMLAVSSIRDRH